MVMVGSDDAGEGASNALVSIFFALELAEDSLKLHFLLDANDEQSSNTYKK